MLPDSLHRRDRSSSASSPFRETGSRNTNGLWEQMQQLYPEALSAGHAFTTHCTNQLTYWVSWACAPVPPRKWQSTPGLADLQLFACSG